MTTKKIATISTIDRETPQDRIEALIAGSVVIHPRVDVDCIGALYELLEWGGDVLPADRINVVIAPKTLPKEMFQRAAFMLDMGDEYDPGDGRFDHHQYQDHNTSATEMVFEWFTNAAEFRGNGRYFGPIGKPFNTLQIIHRQFVWLATQGDLGKSGPAISESRQRGLHALVSAWHMQRVPDATIVLRAIELLDRAIEYTILHKDNVLMGDALVVMAEEVYAEDVAFYAAKRAQAEAEFEQKLVYRSEDGAVVAISGGSPMASQVAYEQGAVLVVYRSDDRHDVAGNVVEYGATGVARNGEAQFPNVSEVVKLAERLFPEIADETADWYKQLPFMAGLSPKAGTTRELRVDLKVLTAAIDAAWQR